MRFHQSWYRKYILELPPGPNPNARGEIYGNLLRKEDGWAGKNFINKKIHNYAKERLAEDSLHIEPKRLRNNLLSSQPMCFNLFAPLALNLDLAQRLISGLPGFEDVAKITEVKLEYAPPKETMLNDGTSFDAWIEYRRTDGKLGFIGIETKLTEPFSQASYDFDERYNRWLDNPEWWWVAGSEANFSNKAYNQLWRNHLLSFALQHQPENRYAESFSAVISHPLDNKCDDALEAYRMNLLPQGKANLLIWPLNDVINGWLAQPETKEEESWLQALRVRYLDIEASEAAWQHTRRKL